MHFSAVPPHRAGQVLASEWGTCFRCWGGVSPPVPSLALAILVQVLLALLVLLQDHHRPGPEAQAKLLNNSIQLLAVLAILLAPTLLAPHLERHRIHVCLIGFRRRYHPLRPFPRPALTNNCSLCPLLTPPCSGGPFTTPLEAPPGQRGAARPARSRASRPSGPAATPSAKRDLTLLETHAECGAGGGGVVMASKVVAELRRVREMPPPNASSCTISPSRLPNNYNTK